MRHLTDEAPDGVQQLSISACQCKEKCGSLKLAIWNAEIQPDPGNPEELITTFVIPLENIPQMVAAMMKHYAELIPEV